MKLPLNGSFVGNLLVLGVGAALGVTGYWTMDHIAGGSETRADSGSSPLGERSEVPWQDAAPFQERATRTDAKKRNGKPVIARGELDRLRREGLNGDPLTRSEMLHRAGAAGARRDVEEALVFGHSLTRLQDRLDYFRGLFGVWSEIDAEGALAYASLHFTTGLLKSELVGLVVNKWGAAHPQEARLWTEQNLSGPTKERALTDLMVGWTRRNPSTAADWLQRSENRSASMVSAVGRTWAEQDPEAAAFWLSGMPMGSARRTATLAVANEWTRQDPAAAADFFEKELNSDAGLDLATIIADVWGTSDPESAALWVADLPTGAIRDQAAGALASVWATRDLEAAARWSDAIVDSSMRSQVVAHLGTSWGALEPMRAVEWLTSLPPDLAEVGLVGALNSWGVVDPAGMRSWVEGADQSAITDVARKSLADVVSQTSIMDSIDIAMGITASEARSDAVARYFREWRKKDDVSAQEWLGIAWEEMTPELQQRLGKEQSALLAPKP